VSERFTLITGRTKEQGQARHLGKDSRAYQQATAFIEMNAEDMARTGITEAQVVHVQTEAGQADLPVRAGALPTGVVFVPLGPAASRLSATETDGTGMPLLKGLRVVIASRAKQSAVRPGGRRPNGVVAREPRQSPVEPT